MSLHYILDGYNLIKSENTWVFTELSLQAQRDLLLKLIVENKPQGSSNNRVTIVFDGTYENSIWGDKSVKGIGVVFSSGETADKKIEEMILNHSNPAAVIVVSDDNGIRRNIVKSGAKIMQTKEFFKRLFKNGHAENQSKTEETSLPESEINDELSKKWLK